MTPAVDRFEALVRSYQAAIPANLSRAKRLREIRWAASLSVLIESIAQEIALGIRPSRPPELEKFRRQIDQHLRAARSTAKFDTRGGR